VPVPSHGSPTRRRALLACLALAACAALHGCEAFTNQVADGMPVRLVPPELLGKPMDYSYTIPLTLLEQQTPAVYRLAPRDVLGIYFEGVLGDKNQPIPYQLTEKPAVTPSLGYPVPVREDGTLALPLVSPIPVQGLTIPEAEQAIRKAYQKQGVLQPGRERLLVTLTRRRTYRVMVVRQEINEFNTTPEGVAGIQISTPQAKRGAGHVIDLPAYENDILHALSQTGGLPGLDTYNQVIIFRNPGEWERAHLLQQYAKVAHDVPFAVPPGVKCPVLRIPLRVRPDEEPSWHPEDVVLDTGDLIFLEARDLDVFYTAGLLPPGEYVLPRDRDLNVVEALSFVKGPLINGAFINPQTGNIIPIGLGVPSPSLLTVLRRIPGGGTLPIRVDLYRAFRDPRERIVIRPKDVLVLQETPTEAFVRYLTQTLNFSFTSTLFRTSSSVGAISGSMPGGFSSTSAPSPGTVTGVSPSTGTVTTVVP
jgi:hypothetical protein